MAVLAKILYAWFTGLGIEFLTIFLEVLESTRSTSWLLVKCNENEEFRKNINSECQRAMFKLNSGIVPYFINEFFSRFKWYFGHVGSAHRTASVLYNN
jgi:hypothetical protein